MKSKSQLLLFGLALMVSLAGAWFEKTPGYMDAEYYYGNAVRLAQNNGWTEMVLWNYLDSPEGLPHAAHVYWMPLASFLAAASLMIFKTSSFFVARFPFILLSAFIPPLTAEISYSFSQNHRNAVLSGLLAVFSGFYCIYTHNVETFTLYMLLGGLFFLMIQKEPARINRRYVLMMGALAGGMHLSRADGLLWLVAGMGLIFIKSPESGWRKIKSFLTSAIYLFTGYAVIMSPWYLRNLLEWRTFFPEGISQAIWITNYNQLFIYPASRLSFQNWIAAGWSVLLSQRWSALMDNLKTVIGVQSMVILLPLMVWGVWRQKTKTAVRFGLMMEGITLFVMSLIFPLAGARGGFLHSSAAIQPLLWALVPEGLTGFVQWGSRVRRWDKREAFVVFFGGLFLLTAAFSGVIFQKIVIGDDFKNTLWEKNARNVQIIQSVLIEEGKNPNDIIMINNPPGFFAGTFEPAVVIPDGDIESSIEVAQRYNVKYLVLEKDHVPGLDDLYKQPRSLDRLLYITTVDEMRFFRFEQ